MPSYLFLLFLYAAGQAGKLKKKFKIKILLKPNFGGKSSASKIAADGGKYGCFRRSFFTGGFLSDLCLMVFFEIKLQFVIFMTLLLLLCSGAGGETAADDFTCGDFFAAGNFFLLLVLCSGGEIAAGDFLLLLTFASADETAYLALS